KQPQAEATTQDATTDTAQEDGTAQGSAAAKPPGEKTSERKGSSASRRRPKQVEEAAPVYGPAQQRVWQSFIHSRVHSRQWDSHGVNLIPELWRLLKTRVQADRKTTGRTELALGHYLDAALRTAPLEQNALVELADGLQTELQGLPKGKKSTLPLSPEGIRIFDKILELLDAADYNRKGKDAVCALVLQLLRDLQDEGPMPKPAAKRLM
ncbi:hypothetical protein, partial [Streptomyces rhizosphaericus]